MDAEPFDGSPRRRSDCTDSPKKLMMTWTTTMTHCDTTRTSGYRSSRQMFGAHSDSSTDRRPRFRRDNSHLASPRNAR